MFRWIISPQDGFEVWDGTVSGVAVFRDLDGRDYAVNHQGEIEDCPESVSESDFCKAMGWVKENIHEIREAVKMAKAEDKWGYV